MKRFIRSVIILLCAVFTSCVFLSCASSFLSADTKSLSDGIRARRVKIESNISETSENLLPFSLELFRKCFSGQKNVLVSPLSAAYSLSMTANGASGNTLNEMERVLGAKINLLNEFFHEYSRNPGDDLFLANSIWIKDAYDFTAEQSFLQTNADYYGSDIFKSLFNDNTVRDINGWVSRKTDGRINSLLDSISENAVMHIINALAFDGQWLEEFDSSKNKNSNFFPENGMYKQLDYMCSTENVYYENLYCSGFRKKYKSGASFVALLPSVSLSALVSELSAGFLKNLFDSSPAGVSAEIMLPKFTTEYNVEMSDVLIGLGMKDLFDMNRADLTKLGKCSGGENLYASRVLHRTFIDVNENGTKAAAATDTEIGKSTSAPPKTKQVFLTRPFIYFILDKNDLPVFAGSYMQ